MATKRLVLSRMTPSSGRRFGASAFVGTVFAAVTDIALAQQALPTIDVGARRPVAHKPAPRVARPVAPATVTPAAPSPVAPPPHSLAQNLAGVGRGPTDVVGYVAGGTSTATKTATKIMDIPQSMTILTKNQLLDRASQSVQQALAYVPGVTIAGGEGNADQIVIRGQTTTADFFRDGVRDDAEYVRDLYNIQAVEVLKGPSALIFGRGGGGGVVNRVTKKADGETIRAIDVSTGSFGRKRVTVDVGQALSDTLAFRVNGLYEQSYGYRNFFDMERWGINPTLTWKPLENTVVTLGYEHFHDSRVVDRGVPSFNGFPLPTARYTFFGDGFPNVKDANHSTVDVDQANLTIEHKTDFGLEIRNHTSYQNFQKHYQNTFAAEAFEPGDPSVVGITGYKRSTPRESLFNQTDLIYKFQMTPEIRHTLLAGVEVGHQKSASSLDFPCFNFNCATSLVDAPAPLSTIYSPVAFANPAERRRSDLLVASGYAQDQIAITKYVDVLAGVRYDRFDLKFTGQDFPAANTSGDGDVGESNGAVNGYLRRVDNKVSPRFGLVVKPFEQLSLYGSYSRSFLPVAGDQFVLLTPSLANIAPQGFENFEAGFKAQILPRLYFTGALYQLNRSNQPLVVNALNSVLGDTRTNGGELGLVGYVTDEWQASLGYGHQSGYVRRGDPAFLGKVTPFVPKDTFSFWNKYDVSNFFGAAPGVLGIGAGVIYNAKFFAALDNSVVVPGYARVDGALYVKLTDKISAQLNVENIAGAHYFVAATSNNNILPGAPRSAYLTLNAKF